MKAIKSFFFGGAGGGDRIADIGLLVMRLIMGLSLCLSHGLGKVQHPENVVNMLQHAHVPYPHIMVWPAALTEFIGGLLIAIGLFTRPTAVAVIILMCVAFFHMHAGMPYGKRELAAVYFAMAALLLLAGGGRFSVDRLIHKK